MKQSDTVRVYERVEYVGWIVDKWLRGPDLSYTQADTSSDAGRQTSSDGRL